MNLIQYGFASCLCLLAACSATEPERGLRLIEQYRLDIAEPSGLAITADGQTLWVVSDDSSTVYAVDLRGRILGSHRLGEKDLEGVAVTEGSELAVVGERARKLVVFQPGKGKSRSAKLPIKGKDNMGAEGLAFNSRRQEFYVIKEKSPGLLLTLNKDLKEVSRTVLHFAADYSGLDYEPLRGHLWILSDESRSIRVLNGKMEVQAAFSLDIVQPEGIAVDYRRKRVYVVSDKTENLYVYQFPDY